MVAVFDNILQKAQVAGHAPSMERASINWFRQMAQNTNANPAMMLKSDKTRLTSVPLIGRMYMFQYDAKGKKTLPYWDKFPLIIPFDSARTQGKATNQGAFYGLNLHYLHPVLRAKLMDAMFMYVTNTNLDESTRLKISYSLLQNASKAKYFRPCIKKYLIGHLRSKFFYIEPAEWNMAIMLPTQKFVGESATTVWKESKDSV
jgi:hypothetical protein